MDIIGYQQRESFDGFDRIYVKLTVTKVLYYVYELMRASFKYNV